MNQPELTIAYVLINTDSGSEKQVISIAKSSGIVIEAFVCFGLYGVLLKVEVDSIEKLKDLLVRKYRKINNVKSIIVLFIENKKEVLSLEALIRCKEYLSFSKEKMLKVNCIAN